MEVTRWENDWGAVLWLAALEDVAPEEWPGLFAQMDPQRQSRCRRYARQADRRRCVLADALARHALGQTSQVPPASIRFWLQGRGKPQAPGLGVEFSLSHSGSLVLCATAPFPIGADLQRHRPLSDTLVRRMARAGYQGSCDGDFFAWWVRQEAAGKLTGQGLSLSPLPPGLAFSAGTLERNAQSYSYCLCGEKSSLSLE